ncbi:monocarboxylate transporter 12-like [Ptychodera flava]|uniref:monocarboxylate transporter 12-like n=1 Tax=Ptychodera flava TaxID=63121 RepID=UPI00396A6F4A
MENFISMATVTDRKYDKQMPSGIVWKWMVLLGSHTSIMLCAGLPPTMGAVMTVLRKVFDENAVDTSWVVSLAISMVSFGGPLSSALSNKYGARKVVAFGALLGTIGMILSSNATSVSFLYVSYGLVTGLGYGLAFTPSIGVLDAYFNERFVLANAVAFTGTSAGLFAFPPLLHFLLERYGWKGTFMTLSALSANLFVSAAIFRPVNSKPSRKSKPRNIFTIAYGLSIPPTLLNISLPTNLDVTSETDITHCVVSPAVVDRFKSILSRELSDHSSDEDSGHVSNAPLSRETSNTENTGSLQYRSEPSQTIELTDEIWTPTVNKGLYDERPIPYLYDGKFCDLMQCTASASMKTNENETCIRSITSRSNYVRRVSEVAVTQQACANQLNGRQHFRKVSESREAESAKRGFKILDLSLYRTKPLFVGLTLSFFFVGIGYNASLVYLVSRAMEYGISPSDAAVLASVVGIFNIIGQLGHAWFVQMKFVTGSQAYYGSLGICGITSFLSVWMTSHVTYGVYCAILGLCSGVFMTVIVVVCKEYVGEEKLSDAIGLALPPYGVGSLIGPPLSGWLFDSFGSHDGPNYLCSATFLMASMCVLMELFTCRSACHSRGNDPSEEQNANTEIESTNYIDKEDGDKDKEADFIYVNSAYLNDQNMQETEL